MPHSDWSRLEVGVLSGTVEDLRTVRLPGDVAALLVDCSEPHAAILVLGPRTSTPLIVLADTDEAGAATLVASGAEEVLPRSAAAIDVLRAARHASARRLRLQSGQPPSSSAPAGSLVLSSAGAVPPRPSPRLVRPTSGGPADMPPQLQAVGRLAGGVGHDFNNLLQVIGGSAEQLVHDLEVGDSRRESAQVIVDAARRAATLTQQLLAFGRRQTLIATSIDLVTFISESMPHLRAHVGGNVEISTTLTPGLPPVHADRSQLLEALSNLADNAAAAMPDGGRLSIETDVVDVDPAMRRDRPWLRPGRYVRLVVTDTGTGIEPDVLPHLFEPFFSTRAAEGAVGLGLSSVYGIVKQTGGFIWVESEVGRGTTVTILLPPAPVAAESTSVSAASVRGRVMLVEDDESVRELLVGVLTHYGYEVQACGTAEEALAEDRPFDLLLSDVLLPGMNGPELAREVRRVRPGVPVLLMSGDTGHVVDPKELDARGFLQKPFTARTLVERVEELLRNSGRGGTKPPRQA